MIYILFNPLANNKKGEEAVNNIVKEIKSLFETKCIINLDIKMEH